MPDSTRRSFLQAAAAAPLLTGPFASAGTRPRSQGSPKKILVLGGTGWLGPAFVRSALERGHELTLWNRGRSNPNLFPDVEKLVGQRRRPNPARENAPAQDLSALEGRKWDAVLDTSAYFTGEVEDVAAVLKDHVAHYVLISSLSVYASLEKNNDPVDEQSPLCECEDKYTFDMGRQFERYGALKRYCEDAAEAAFPGRTAKIRPGYIVGPGDGSDRFTYWPARFDRGGECLAPGDKDNDLQFIDVRDLGRWLVHVVENEISGPFNAVGFDGRMSVEEFLHTGKTTRNLHCEFTWVPDDFLEENNVSSWQEMGCWTPAAKNGHSDNARAIAAGLQFRPVADTIRDTAEWCATRKADYQWRAGMTAERERELLAKWHAR